jgi:signal transduction histidine kinase
VGGGVALLYLLLPRLGPVPAWAPRLLLYGSVSASAVVALLVGTARHRPADATPWRLLAAGQFVYLLADLTFYSLHDLLGWTHYPGPADLLYLGHYPFVLLGLLALVRIRAPSGAGDRASLIDAAIVATSLVALAWVFVIEPAFHQRGVSLPARATSAAYPALDTLLLVLAAWLVNAGGVRPPAFYLFVASLSMLLATDTAYTLAQLGGVYTTTSLDGKLLDAGWLSFYLLLGAAALHPSMQAMTERDSRAVARSGRGRMILLATAAILAPAMLTAQSRSLAAEPADITLLGACCIVLFLLAAYRMWALVRDGETKAAQLRVQGQELRATIDAHQDAERRLREALAREHAVAEELRELDRLKGTFLQAVSHDLRTPLASILGIGLTVRRGLDVLPAVDVADLLDRLVANARKLDRIVADLLDLDRLTDGTLHPRRRPTEAAALVHRVADGLDILGDREVEIDAVPVTVPLDTAKVERIVENLLTNAAKHTPAGTKIWVRVRPAGGGEPGSDGLLLVVEDAGPGVPPELRDAIFSPFTQGPSASEHAPGSGVGLSLVARFAELHGGRAWVEDRPGGGASFHVILPAGGGPEAPDTPAATAAPPGPEPEATHRADSTAAAAGPAPQPEPGEEAKPQAARLVR